MDCKVAREGHMLPHTLRSDCVCVCNNMLPVGCILGVAEGCIIHELLCGWLRVEGSQGIHQLITSVHCREGVHPGNSCLLGGVHLKQT